MADQLTFGATPRRRRGISRTQLDVTLYAWRDAGVLSGPEHAAYRSALRDAAEAVDAARAALRDGQGSPYTLSICTRTLTDLLVAVRPVAGGDDSGDTFAAFLAGIGTPAVPD